MSRRLYPSTYILNDSCFHFFWERERERSCISLLHVNPADAIHGAHQIALEIPSTATIRHFFSFLYLKKYKISKIYGGFKKFQKWTPIAHGGRRPPIAQAMGDRDIFVTFFLRTGPWRGTWAGPPPSGDRAGQSYLNPPSPLTPHSII